MNLKNEVNDIGKLPNYYVKYYDNGNIYLEYYSIRDELHKDGGPAFIEYNRNGNKSLEIYYTYGKVHNDNGPAVIAYSVDGDIESKEYWLNGTKYSDVLEYLVMAGCLKK